MGGRIIDTVFLFLQILITYTFVAPRLCKSPNSKQKSGKKKKNPKNVDLTDTDVSSSSSPPHFELAEVII